MPALIGKMVSTSRRQVSARRTAHCRRKFTEVVTGLYLNGTVATFAVAPTQSANSFFELYYNSTVVANNLAGTRLSMLARWSWQALPPPTCRACRSFPFRLREAFQILRLSTSIAKTATPASAP